MIIFTSSLFYQLFPEIPPSPCSPQLHVLFYFLNTPFSPVCSAHIFPGVRPSLECLFGIAVIKHLSEATLAGKQVYFILYFSVYCQEKSKQKLKADARERNHRRMLLVDLLSCATLDQQPRGHNAHQHSGTFLHQEIKKVSHRHANRPLEWRLSLN